MPCLIAFVRADSFAEGMKFVDHINGLKGNPVKNRKKYLILMTPTIDKIILQNKTIAFNVHIINQGKTGMVAKIIFVCVSNSSYFVGDGPAITSLCPALGKKHSVIQHGLCPSNLQQPHGKEIPISGVGMAPYVILNKEKEVVGGAEFDIMTIFAKKFGFTPKFTMVPSVPYAIQQVNEKNSEMALGQASYFHSFYQMIEYMPYVYTYTFVAQSQKPAAIISFDTLTYPFDKYIWYFTISFSMAVFTLLISIQQCWIHTSKMKPPHGWIFQGMYIYSKLLLFGY